MPRDLRALSPDDSLAAIGDELIYTISALQADPRAAALLSLTEGWLTTLDEVRKVDRKARVKVVNAEARRVVSNENLDNACEAFGAALLDDVEGDRSSARWKAFFIVPVASFVRLSLRRQVEGVEHWLERDDPLLATHREALTQWSAAAAAAVEDTRRLAVARSSILIAREQLAEDISREREALLCGLLEIASDEVLPPTWPEAFFYRGGVLARQ